MTIEYKGREWHHQEFVVCMGFDAFRLCTGRAPKYFTPEEVKRWIDAAPKGKATQS